MHRSCSCFERFSQNTSTTNDSVSKLVGNADREIEGKRDILDVQWSELEYRKDFMKNRLCDIFEPDMF